MGTPSSKILNNLRSIFRSGIVTKTTTMICMEVRVLLELPLLNFFRSVSGIINNLKQGKKLYRIWNMCAYNGDIALF